MEYDRKLGFYEKIAFFQCKCRNSVDRERWLQKLIAKATQFDGAKKPYYRVVMKGEYLDGSV